MSRRFNLEKMTSADLVALRTAIENELAARANEDKAGLRTQLAEIAKAKGYHIDEIFPIVRNRRPELEVRYRDPENPMNTWTGRGRMPLWLVEAIKQRGKKKDDFLVPDKRR